MRRMMLWIMVVLSYATAQADDKAPYAGQQTRAIKALSAQRVDGLLAGKGLGYAKVAELNGYPGPAHVLELTDALHLSEAQIKDTRAIFEAMQSAAQALGAELVTAERRLDALFQNGEVSQAEVLQRLEQIGAIEGRLRAAHVNAHLRQQALLSPEQIQKYIHLRGYAGDGHKAGHHHGHGHQGH